MLFILVGVIAAGGLLFFSDEVGASVGNSDISNKYDLLFIKHANAYGFDWKILKRIAWIESRIGEYKSVKLGISNPKNIKDSVSYDGLSWGIMQTTLATSRDYDATANEEKLNNPDYSIKIGAAHYAFLRRSYPTFKERDLVMSYNHGQGNQLRFLQKEKEGTLLPTEYFWGRDYWSKYNKARGLIP